MSTAPNPFAGMKGTPSSLISATGRLKIAVIGKPKSGKSTFAATARKPIRYYDFDDRPEALEGKDGLFVLSRPTMLDVETDLSIIKANKIKGVPIPATVVFDSVTYMNRAMEEEIFRQDKSLYRLIRVGNSTSMKIRNSWDTINGIQRYMEYLIAEFSPLMDVIFVYHEKAEKDYAESTPTQTAYTDQLTIDPQYLSKSLSLFNEVYRISVDGNKKYTVECRPTWSMNTSTSLLLDNTEEPDILRMIQKHEEKRAALALKA